MVNISFEQLISYDPDMIFVQEKSLWDELDSNKPWQRLRAVKNGKVYKIPTNRSAGWIGRPPLYA
jgi:iron complex transport system substrate-binding protein